ncbi:hypothetical protein TeGR_g12196 [Tetraparma gracilis]|uniref:Uncharacterized protein n=1 Tax=Tetraparma gracilis TaxID=2962635 RepID=A0ABQ6MV59_9STRA|nr:hypothetical protein TeGR_g12196 [Tetraparma gracilis]
MPPQPSPPAHVVGPSHLHICSLCSLPLLPALRLLRPLRSHAFPGLPLSSPLIREALLSVPPECAMYLLVPDLRFGNYDPGGAPPRTLNVCRRSCTPRVDEELVEAAIPILEGLLRDFPRLTLVPWDLMVRGSIASLSYGGFVSHPALGPRTLDVRAAAAAAGLARLADGIVLPAQRRLAIVRPRRRTRGLSLRLNLAYLLVCLYQLHLFLLTRLQLAAGVGRWGGGGYRLGLVQVLGWEEFRRGAPPLLTGYGYE